MSSGKASVAYKMEELKLGDLSDDQASEVLAQVNAKGIAKRDILNDTEFTVIVEAVRTKDAA